MVTNVLYPSKIHDDVVVWLLPEKRFCSYIFFDNVTALLRGYAYAYWWDEGIQFTFLSVTFTSIGKYFWCHVHVMYEMKREGY